MKIRTQETFGIVLALNVPESVEEFDTLAKRAGACLDAGIDQIVYHDQLGKIRKGIVAEIVKARETNPNIPERLVVGQGPKKKDGSTSPVYEKDTVFIDRVKSSGAISPADFAALGQAVADATPFDPSASTSSSQIAKKFYNFADGVIAAVAAGQSSWERFEENFLSENPDFEFEKENGAPTRDSLAAAFKADELRVLAQAQAANNRFLK